MRVVAFQNQKGGVGKSTLSLLVAEQLAKSGREVISLDNDPQGNSTQWFLNRLTDADYPLILGKLQSKNLYNLLQEWITPENALLELTETTVQFLAATPNYKQAKTAFRDQPGHENLIRMLLRGLST